MRLLDFAALGLLISTAFAAEQPTDPVVETSLGKIRGSTMSSVSGRSFVAYRGVPYAAPPLRFQDPVAVKPWTGVLDATHDGPICVQMNMNNQIVGQEDCLMLNVYTHQNSTSPHHPVMVWIHGGGFQMGSGNGETFLYGPKIFMDRDIVLVTINYRLGPLGFFTTDSEEAPGNYGLLDQTMALKWIQEQIHHFGGDPKSVTIFGESAGGASVDLHILSPLSKGLFHKAIAQSGTSLCNWVMPLAVTKHSYELTKKLGCLDKAAGGGLECLLTKKAEEFFLTPEDPYFFYINFGPRIDVERQSPFLPSAPIDLLTSGRFNQVPLIIGLNRNEGLFSLGTSGVLRDADRMKKLEEDPLEFLPHLMFIPDHRHKYDIVRRALHQYLDPNKPIRHQLSQLEKMISDITFSKGIHDSLALFTRHSSEVTYAYFYTHHAEKGFMDLVGSPSNSDDVCHADELFLMFNTEIYPQITSDRDLRVSKTLMDLWTSFATLGYPHSDVAPHWPPTTEKKSQYLNIKFEPVVMDEEMPYHSRLSFWDQISRNLPARDEL